MTDALPVVKPAADLRKQALQGRVATDQALAAGYQSGATLKDLAAEHDLQPKTVRARLERLGVTLRSNRRLSQAQIAEAKELYETGLSTKRIGDRHGVSHNTIRRHLQDMGVRMRPMGRPPRQSPRED